MILKLFEESIERMVCDLCKQQNNFYPRFGLNVAPAQTNHVVSQTLVNLFKFRTEKIIGYSEVVLQGVPGTLLTVLSAWLFIVVPLIFCFQREFLNRESQSFVTFKNVINSYHCLMQDVVATMDNDKLRLCQFVSLTEFAESYI